MTSPSLSQLTFYTNKRFTDKDWSKNFTQVYNWITGGYDLAASSLTTTGNISASGTITTSSGFVGDGSGITGLTGTTDKYQIFTKFLYAPYPIMWEGIVNSATTISGVTAYLLCDAGIQKDSMDATTGWSAVNGGAGVALNTIANLEGTGCIEFYKNTSNAQGGITKTTFSSFSVNGKKVRFWIYLPPTDFSKILRVNVNIGSDTYQKLASNMVAGWNLIETSTLADAAVTTITINVETNATGDTVGSISGDNIKIDHIVVTPDSTLLNVDLYKNNTTHIISGADAYTFPGLLGGALITKTISPAVSVAAGDRLTLRIPTTSTYAGQSLTVTILTT